MKLISNIKSKFTDLVNIYRQIKLDNKYYNDYKEMLSQEFADRESKFVSMGLKLAEDRETITYTFKIPEEFQTSGKDWMIYDKLNENTYFITEFLKTTVGLHHYISQVPEYFHVEDPNSNDLSLTYIAFWKFQKAIDKSLKSKVIFGTVGVVSFIIGLITAGVFLYFV